MKTEEKICRVCEGQGTLLDSQGGTWDCPKCGGKGSSPISSSASSA